MGQRTKFGWMKRHICLFTNLLLVAAALILTTSCGGGGGGSDRTVVVDPGNATNRVLTVTPLTPSITADGASTSVVNATLTTLGGTPIAGESISFTQNGTVLTTQTTDQTGKAVYTYTSTTVSGNVNIDAVWGDLTSQATITQTSGPAAGIALNVDAGEIVANGQTTATITVTVLDSNTNPVANETVTVSTTHGTLSAPAVTDDQGRTTVTLTSDDAGTAEITVKVGDSASSKIKVECVDGPTIILAALETSGKIADGVDSYTVRAQILDATGRALGGESITCRASGQTGLVAINPPESLTQEDGTTTCTVTDISSVEDTVIIRAYSGDVASGGSIALTFAGNGTGGGSGGNAVILQPDNPVPADGVSEATITVTLKDASNNPVADALITLESSSATTVIGAPNPTQTDATGQAIFRITDTVAGTVTLTASSGGVASVVVTQTFLPLVATVTAISTIPGDAVPASGVDTIQITFEIKNIAGDPVAKQQVSFVATGEHNNTSPVIFPSSNKTDGNGRVTMSVRDTTAQNVTITARAENVTGAKIVEFTPLPPANIILASASPNPTVSIAGVGAISSATLRFQVVDTNSQPVQGSHSVDFSIVAGGLNGGEKLSITNTSTVNSLVSTVFNSGTKAGTVQVRASLTDDPSISADVTVIVTGGLPSGNRFGLSGTPLNREGRLLAGLTQDIRVDAADFFGNPVAPNVGVWFQTDFAKITGADVFLVDADGNSSTAGAVVTSGQPFPPDGRVTLAAQTIGGIRSKVLSLAVDENDSNIIYAGTDGGGVYKTTDGGVSWSQVGAPIKTNGEAKQANLTGTMVRDLVMHPGHPEVLYAATNKGVFVSSNSGENWLDITGLRRVRGVSLGTAAGAAYGADGRGETFDFTYANTQARSRTTIKVNGAAVVNWVFTGTGIQFFGTPGNSLPIGAAITADYDTSAAIPGNPPFLSLAVNPDPAAFDAALGHGKEIYAGTRGAGLWKTVDGGNNWISASEMAAGQTVTFGTDILSLAINSLATNQIYAGSDGDGLYRSDNSAASWTKAIGVEESEVRDIVLEPLAPAANNIWVAGSHGIHYTADGGTTWQVPPVGVNATDATNTDVRALVRDANDGTLYAATFGDVLGKSLPRGGVYVSTDGGVNWSKTTNIGSDVGLHALDALAIFGQAGDDIVMAGSEGRSVAVSQDSGTTWSLRNGTAPANLTNQLFATMRVLHSGNTVIGVLPYAATYQPMNNCTAPGFGNFGTIYNQEAHEFYIRVSDDLGHRLTKDSQISITVTAGKLYGDTSASLLDATYGGTDYYVTWDNDKDTCENPTVETLNVTVTSDNGDASASVNRLLLCALATTKTSVSLGVVGGAGGGTVSEQIVAVGGSSTGYTYSQILVQGAITPTGFYTFDANGVAAGTYKDIVYVTDNATCARVTVEVTITVTAP